jgi:glutamate-1-semialdehyde 2,1-aminomutase
MTVIDAERLLSEQSLLPGGGPTAVRFPRIGNPVIARGQGSRVWDVEGRSYVDYLLGSGPLVLGHAHPAVVEAVCRQAKRGSTFYAPTAPTLDLAAQIVAKAPCAEMVQFCSSGSEATMFALRLARAATGRSKVLKFEGAFHGSNDYALMSLAPAHNVAFPEAVPDTAGVPGVLRSEVLIAPYNDLAEVERIVSQHDVAAIIVEPVQRVISPVPGFLAGLRALADRHGAVLIFDEVVTGFRLAPGGAQELFGVTPDLACYGKIIGGGYPLAAVAGSSALMRLADPARVRASDDFVYMSGTLNGNPIAAAAGLATLAVLDEPGSYDRLTSLGERMRAGLHKALTSGGHPGQVLGTGPVFQVVITAEPVVDYRSFRRGDRSAAHRLAETVVDDGNLFTGDKGYLSLVHNDDEVDAFVASYARALEDAD